MERGETDVYPTVCTKYNKKYSQGGSKCICTVVGPQQASGPGAAAHAAAAMKIKIPSCSLQLVSLQCNSQSLLPCRSILVHLALQNSTILCFSPGSFGQYRSRAPSR